MCAKKDAVPTKYIFVLAQRIVDFELVKEGNLQ